MFLILLHYAKPLETVDLHMKAHMTFVRACYREKIFLVSGRRVPRTGGVILARAASREALVEIVERDPFVVEGVATYEIVEFKTSQYAPELAAFAD